MFWKGDARGDVGKHEGRSDSASEELVSDPLADAGLRGESREKAGPDRSTGHSEEHLGVEAAVEGFDEGSLPCETLAQKLREKKWSERTETMTVRMADPG